MRAATGYGASDQAFYIPAILKQLDPARFPRDTALIGPQARYFFGRRDRGRRGPPHGLADGGMVRRGYVLSLVMLYVAFGGSAIICF